MTPHPHPLPFQSCRCDCVRMFCSAGCAQGVLGSHRVGGEHKMELAKTMTKWSHFGQFRNHVLL